MFELAAMVRHRKKRQSNERELSRKMMSKFHKYNNSINCNFKFAALLTFEDFREHLPIYGSH